MSEDVEDAIPKGSNAFTAIGKHEMTDHLRDAIRDAMPGDKQFAEKLADAIRDEIDERIERAEGPMTEVVASFQSRLFRLEDAKLQPAKPQPQVADVEMCAEHRVPLTTCEIEWYRIGSGGNTPCKPAEPRRNPYADWETYDDYQEYTKRDMRRARFEAWNEGAQIAGGRDE